MANRTKCKKIRPVVRQGNTRRVVQRCIYKGRKSYMSCNIISIRADGLVTKHIPKWATRDLAITLKYYNLYQISLFEEACRG